MTGPTRVFPRLSSRLDTSLGLRSAQAMWDNVQSDFHFKRSFGFERITAEFGKVLIASALTFPMTARSSEDLCAIQQRDA